MQSITKIIPRKKVHFVGIGGVGMSALAQLLLSQGYVISGSDIKESKTLKRLRFLGAKVKLGHSAGNVEEVDVVVYSSCIKDDNPEIISARKKRIKIIRRSLLLAYIMQNKFSIAVAGAHGKTTTTALISFLLQKSGMNPSFAIGAYVDILGGNAQHGEGKYFVAEADESDSSFLHLNPDFAVITNIDREHLDYYKNLKNIINAYAQFVARVDKKGTIFCYGQDKNINKALWAYKGKLVTYGLGGNYDIYAVNIHCQEMKTEFDCVYKRRPIGTFKLNIPGVHNVLNSLACIALGMELSIDVRRIKLALASFSGAHRRFQIKNFERGITIVDDYAHHPTEIAATLSAAKTWKNRRVVGVFQPHRYSRTKFLKKEFGQCFNDVDHLVITDIYAASEAPIQGIGAKTIYEQVKQSGHKDVHFLPRDEVNEYLMKTMRDGDLLMMLGAGDIETLTEELIEKLSMKERCDKK